MITITVTSSGPGVAAYGASLVPLMERLVAESAAAGEVLVKAETQRLVYDPPPTPYYVRTGFLINSIGHRIITPGYAIIFASARYARFVHEGFTRGSFTAAPRPFMSRGLLRLRTRLPDIARSIFGGTT